MKAEVRQSMIYIRPETEEERRITDAIFEDGAQVVGGGSELTLTYPSQYGRAILLLEAEERAVLAYALGVSGAAFTGNPIVSRLVERIINLKTTLPRAMSAYTRARPPTEVITPNENMMGYETPVAPPGTIFEAPTKKPENPSQPEEAP